MMICVPDTTDTCTIRFSLAWVIFLSPPNWFRTAVCTELLSSISEYVAARSDAACRSPALTWLPDSLPELLYT